MWQTMANDTSLLQECIVYLCGTKVDLVEENKKARKVDVHMVRDYADGECVCTTVYAVATSYIATTEINAKYMETSAKTGYNIGKIMQLSHCQPCHATTTTEQMFMTIAEDFVSHNKTTKAG